MYTDIAQIEKDLAVLEAGIASAAALYDRLCRQDEEVEAQLAAVESELDNVRAAQALLNTLCSRSRDDLCRHLSSMVTSALQYVYGPDLSFVVQITYDKNGSAHLDYHVETADGLSLKPQEAMGGGVVDTISIALRIAFLTLMNNPPLPGPVILDEPGRHLDPESAARLGEFLRYVAETTGRQFIVVTHHDSIIPYADRAYMVSQAGGWSVVTNITTGEE